MRALSARHQAAGQHQVVHGDGGGRIRRRLPCCPIKPAQGAQLPLFVRQRARLVDKQDPLLRFTPGAQHADVQRRPCAATKSSRNSPSFSTLIFHTHVMAGSFQRLILNFGPTLLAADDFQPKLLR